MITIRYADFVNQLSFTHSFASISFFIICLRLLVCLQSLPPKRQQQNGTLPRPRLLSLFFKASQLGLEAPVLRRVPSPLQQIILKIFILKVPSLALKKRDKSLSLGSVPFCCCLFGGRLWRHTSSHRQMTKNDV
jgi:hypothetical protein